MLIPSVLLSVACGGGCAVGPSLVYPGAGGAGVRFVVFDGRLGNLRALAPATRALFDAEEPISRIK